MGKVGRAVGGRGSGPESHRPRSGDEGSGLIRYSQTGTESLGVSSRGLRAATFQSHLSSCCGSRAGLGGWARGRQRGTWGGWREAHTQPPPHPVLTLLSDQVRDPGARVQEKELGTGGKEGRQIAVRHPRWTEVSGVHRDGIVPTGVAVRGGCVGPASALPLQGVTVNTLRSVAPDYSQQGHPETGKQPPPSPSPAPVPSSGGEGGGVGLQTRCSAPCSWAERGAEARRHRGGGASERAAWLPWEDGCSPADPSGNSNAIRIMSC